MPVTDFVLVRILGARGHVHKAYFTRGELGAYVNQQLLSEEVQTDVDAEVAIFKNALTFGVRRAADIMTPLSSVVGVELGSDVAVLRQLFIDTGYSKIVVYGGAPRNILGYVHSFALFQNPQDIASVMVSVVRASETIFIKDLLRTLTRRRRSMAVVLGLNDEAVGIVTVEDIVEELFGEIEDEHDLDVPVVKQSLSEKAWLFSARIPVEEINAELGLGLPVHSAYTTLGGLLVYFSKANPYKGLRVAAGDYVFYVEEAAGQKIELIKVEKITFE